MKNRNILLLSSILLICSCSNNNSTVVSESSSTSSSSSSIESSSSSIVKENKETYATLYSSDEEVMIYGYVGMEAFDLDTINFNRVASSNLRYETSDDVISISNNKITFVKTGVATIYGYDNEESSYKINVIVNDTKENQYNYPYEIDYSSYNLKSGNKTNVTYNDDSVTLTSADAKSTSWTRITYDINSNLNKDMFIEVDAKVNSSVDSSRWFGLVFKDNEKGANKYPFYQYDVRMKPSSSNGMELTYFSNYADGTYSYSYPYQGKDDFIGNISPGDTIKLAIALSSNKATCYYNNDKEFEAEIGSNAGGNIGFQVSGCSVTFSNLKISYKNDSKNFEASRTITNANETNSYVTSSYSSSLRPNIIASGLNEDELMGVGYNVSQFYAIAKEEDGNLNLYDINNNKMDFSLEYLYKWYKGSYIANLEVNDTKTVDLIHRITKASAILEYAIFSSNNEVLDYVNDKYPGTRLGYVCNETSINNNDDVTRICQSAGKSSAYQIVIDSSVLTKNIVTAFTGRGYSIIGKANGNNGSVIDATLDGCSNILVKYSKVTAREVAMIENDSIFASNSLFYQPYATAHRGAGTNGDNIESNICENTLSSFDKAFERGALALEIDVHTTADNELVVIHDGNTSGISSTNVTVASSTLAKLQSLKLNIGNDHIPSLKEVFTKYSTEEYKDKTLVIEVKDNSFKTGKAIIELSKEYGWYGRFVLITFDSSVCAKLHDYDPSIPCSYLGTVYRNSVETFYDAYKTYYLQGVGLSSNMACINKYGNEEQNARGEIHWVWTFNQTNNSTMTRYLNEGLRAMTTNHIRYFEKNYYKLESNTSITMNKNETKTLEAKAISYTGSDSITDFDIILISGNATINKTSITKNDDNEIKVCLKYKATWKDNTTTLANFYVYSDVITIK